MFKVLLGIFFILSYISIVSAEVMLFQPAVSYSYGDSIQVSALVRETFDKSGFLYMYLNCDSQTSNNFHMEYVSLASGQEKTIQPSAIPIDGAFFNKNINSCKISVIFLNESAETPVFSILSGINVSAYLENATVDSGSNFVLSGTATKNNGKNADGYLELKGDDLNINIVRKIERGVFNINISIPENAKQGMHVLNARAYEQDKNEQVTNEGTLQVWFTVRQKPTRLDVAMENQNFIPGSVLKFKPLLYDQSGEIISENIYVKIINPKGKVVYENILKSNEEKILELPSNVTPSTNENSWAIEVQAIGLNAKRMFSVEQLMKANFVLTNNTLRIINLGNVPYKKSVKVTIGGKEEIINVELNVGESKEYNLRSGESGEREVIVSDGVDTITEKVSFVGTSGITTNAIDVSEFKEKGSSFLPRYSMAWFFLIFVFVLFIILMIEKVGKKKEFTYAVDKKESLAINSRKVSSKDFISVSENSNIKRAEYALVMDGHKEEACLIGLKIKNIEQIGKFEHVLLGKIEQHINNNKGLVYRKDNFIVGLFTSLMTKSVKNELTATKVASQIEKEIANYNKLAKTQIDFGIAVNSGQLVLKKEAESIKFTSMSNTLPLTKKLADIAKREFLLSEHAYKKIMTDVKAKRIAQDGFNVYRIEEIKPKEEYKQFVNQFMSRQNQEKPFRRPSWISQPKVQPEEESENPDNQKGFNFL